MPTRNNHHLMTERTSFRLTNCHNGTAQRTSWFCASRCIFTSQMNSPTKSYSQLDLVTTGFSKNCCRAKLNSIFEHVLRLTTWFFIAFRWILQNFSVAQASSVSSACKLFGSEQSLLSLPDLARKHQYLGGLSEVQLLHLPEFIIGQLSESFMLGIFALNHFSSFSPEFSFAFNRFFTRFLKLSNESLLFSIWSKSIVQSCISSAFWLAATNQAVAPSFTSPVIWKQECPHHSFL